MRATLLAFLFALAAACARADQIDNVITNLPDGWNDDASGPVIAPKDAPAGDVLQKVFQKWVVVGVGTITNYTVLKTRQVKIPCGHFDGARVSSYNAYLIKLKQGGQVVVLLRYFDVYSDSGAWANAVVDAEPSPVSARQPAPLTPASR